MSNENAGGQPPSEREIELLREGQALFASELLKIPGVHGVGIGYKKTGGKTTGAGTYRNAGRVRISLGLFFLPEFFQFFRRVYPRHGFPYS